ncbi:hypothetical protein [Longimicrobium sp.]|jgi:hypothetical protein|uniref:hypothetical protein n=1 Tax=Longimicrobium sp. TaxID=2029185 RepID=UPI002F926204
MSEPINYAKVWDDEVDAIIEEIWEVRRKIWERFDNDPLKMGQHYMALERQSGKRVIYGPRLPRARISTRRKGLRRSPNTRVRQ